MAPHWRPPLLPHCCRPSPPSLSFPLAAPLRRPPWAAPLAALCPLSSTSSAWETPRRPRHRSPFRHWSPTPLRGHCWSARRPPAPLPSRPLPPRRRLTPLLPRRRSALLRTHRWLQHQPHRLAPLLELTRGPPTVHITRHSGCMAHIGASCAKFLTNMVSENADSSWVLATLDEGRHQCAHVLSPRMLMLRAQALQAPAADQSRHQAGCTARIQGQQTRRSANTLDALPVQAAALRRMLPAKDPCTQEPHAVHIGLGV